MQNENDIWSWGMSLVKYLDPTYFKKTAITDAFWDRYCENLPESSDKWPKSYMEMVIQLNSLKGFYSPLYDFKTWKLDKDKETDEQISKGKVSEEWWKLLEQMLVRPDLQSKL